MRLLVFILLLVTGTSRAAVIVTNLAAGDYSDVQAAVNATSTGDIIVMPNGTFHWTNQVHFTNRVIRAHPLGTTIVDDTSKSVSGADNHALFLIEVPASNNFAKVAGITILQGTNNLVERTGGTFRLHGQGYVRLDHTTITFTSPFNRGCFPNDGVTGVADHNTWLTEGTQNFFVEHGSWKSGAGTFGDNSWFQPSLFGTTNAWYVENHITTNNALGEANIIDSDRGGRWVVRYSRFQHGTTHGAEVAGNRVRGTRQFEIYNNTNSTDNIENNVWEIRSGCGVVYDNVATDGIGPYTYFMKLETYRAADQPYFWTGLNGQGGWDINVAGGPFLLATNTGGTSPNQFTDSNQSWTNDALRGYSFTNYTSLFKYSMILSNTATTLYVMDSNTQHSFTNGDKIALFKATDGIDITGNGQGDLNSDSTPKWLNPTKERVYGWNNTFNGTTNGTIIAQPPILVEGLFWSNNVVKPSYTALSYPHPIAVEPVVAPASTNVVVGTTVNFSASSGFTPYVQWFMISAPSGGSIDSSTGVYTAGTNPNTSDTIGLYDQLGSLVQATVTVSQSSANPTQPGYNLFRQRRRG